MAVLIPANFAQVTIPFKHALAVRKAAIVFGLNITAVSAPALSGWLNDILTSYGATLGQKLDDNVTAGPARASIGAGSPPYAVTEGTTTFQGIQTSAAVPSNVAVLVRKRTGVGGRRQRGRIYLPWSVIEAGVDEVGVIQTAQLTALQTEAENFRIRLATGVGGALNTPMVILHNSSGVTAPGSPTAVTALSVDSLIGTQRRRLGR